MDSSDLELGEQLGVKYGKAFVGARGDCGFAFSFLPRDDDDVLITGSKSSAKRSGITIVACLIQKVLKGSGATSLEELAQSAIVGWDNEAGDNRRQMQDERLMTKNIGGGAAAWLSVSAMSIY